CWRRSIPRMEGDHMASVARKSRSRPSALECMAYHEAGHVVMAFVCRLGVLRACAVPDDHVGARGDMALRKMHRSLQPDSVNDARAHDRIEREIMVRLAGAVAEAKARGRHNWAGATEDLVDAYHLGAYRFQRGGEVLKQYIVYLLARVRSMFLH